MGSLLLHLTVLIVSTCGLVFELLAGAAGSALLGDTTLRFAVVVGLHLSAMGVGAWLTRYVDAALARRLVHTQLAVALVGGASVPLIYLAASRPAWLAVVLYGLVVVDGALIGAEVPLLLRLLRRRARLGELLAGVMSVEYAGALVASLLVTLVFLPRLGAVRTSLLFGALNAASALVAVRVFASELDDRRALTARALAVLAALGLGAALSSRVTRAADLEVSTDPVIFAQQTDYQRVVVTRGHGGINLFLDGNLQFASSDEYRYHEALVHPAMASARRRARVLVLGGGDGLAVREVLRYPDVERVTLVDLDPGMTALARRAPWLRALNASSLWSPKVRIIHDDAMVWLERDAGARFDVVIVDFPDPNNYSLGKLFTTRFYRLLGRHLDDDTEVVVQATSPLAARRSYWSVVATIEASGLRARAYHAFVPSFGEWGYVLARRGPGVPPLGALPPGLRYFTAEGWAPMQRFAPDISRVPAEVNRLNNQVLVRTYEEEWHRWTH
ncbi:MAG: Spermidine synthase [Myxococcaceae bacterium]|nr:Spermidine synthase [Myxococcaceae bacterium]